MFGEIYWHSGKAQELSFMFMVATSSGDRVAGQQGTKGLLLLMDGAITLGHRLASRQVLCLLYGDYPSQYTACGSAN